MRIPLSRAQRITRCLFFLGLVAQTVSLQAATTTWTADIGDWESPANWSNEAPFAGVDFYINNGGTATLSSEAYGNLGALGTAIGESGALILTSDAALTLTDELRIGDSGTGTLTFNGGTISNTYANIAREGGSTGTVTMNGGTWNNSQWFVIGNAGSGTFTQTGGHVTASEFDIGLRTGGVGVATLSGSSWTTDGNLNIGGNGVGTLNLLAGTTVSVGGNVVISANAIGNGTAAGTLNFGAYDLGHATGAGSLTTDSIVFGAGTGVINFNQNDTLTLDADISGKGTLNVRGTGTTILTGAVNLDAGSSISTITHGTLAISGADASLNYAGTLNISADNSATGQFIVADGAQVTDTAAHISGNDYRTGGMALATGAGTLWNNTSSLNVGYQSGGTLTVSDGATVRVNGGAGTIYFGGNNSTGSLNIGNYDLDQATGGGTLDAAALSFGTGTGWIYFNQNDATTIAAVISGPVTVNQRGSGTTILSGTTNSVGRINITDGTLAITGSMYSGDIYFTNASALQITGSLSSGYVQSSPDSSILVDGGSWTNTLMSIAGILDIRNGANVIAHSYSTTNVAIVLGEMYGATGLMTVDGSTVTEMGDMQIGYRATGALTLLSGASVSATGKIDIAVVAGSVGTLNFGNYDLEHATTGGTITANSLNFGDGAGVINFNQTDDFTFAYSLSGNGSINQRGTGTTTLSGTNTYSGATSVSGGTLEITGSISHPSKNLTVGLYDGDDAHVVIASGASVTNNKGDLGWLAGSQGTVTLEDGASWTNADDLVVGEAGTGTLIATNATIAVLNSSLGQLGGGNGTMTLNGGTWTNMDALQVGASGTGNLTLRGGSVTTANRADLGTNAGAIGSATVSGEGTQWTTTGGFYVGNNGTGTLDISDGATVSVGEVLVLGAGAEAFGTLTLDGGALAGSGEVRIGDNGTGTLNLNSGALSGTLVSLGSNSSGKGIATLNGGTVTSTGEFRVGDSGAGTLTFNDGTISDTYGNLARSIGSSATVTMSGGTWQNSQWFVVGNAGAADFTQIGGSVTATEFDLGLNTGGSGVATLSGGSWTTAGNLNIGQVGAGTLNLLAGATVSIGGNIVIASGSNSTGTLNIGAYDLAHATASGALTASSIRFGSGTGTLNFNQTDDLTFAYALSGNGTVNQRGTATTTLSGNNTYGGGTSVYDGTLKITGSITHLDNSLTVGLESGDNGTAVIADGASVSDYSGTIGWKVGSTGAVSVGDGARWTNATSLYIGSSGTGSLTLADGATVSANSTVNGIILGFNAGASGSVLMNGGTLTNNGEVRVGDSGSGTLTLNAGTISDTYGNLARSIGSTASVTMGGGTWNNSVGFVVGNAGNATFAQTAGTVNAASFYIGLNGGGSGTATLSGATTRWVGTGELHIGESGSGSLTISDGAQVSNAGTGAVAFKSGSTGAVTVTGAGSLWETADNNAIVVGESASGTLLVADGGAVIATNTFYSGYNAGSFGSTVVTGANSSLSAGINLRIGQYENSTGEFTLADGATVTVGRDVYVGNYETSSGTLNIGAYDLAHATTGGTLTVNGIGSDVAVGYRSVILGANGGTGVVNFNQTDAFTLSAPITGNGTVNQRGTGVTTLTGANTYTGETHISGGTLALAVDASLSGPGVIRVDAGASFDVSALTDSGGFTLGAGQTLAGNGTVLGNTTIAGTLAPGASPGLLTFDGNLTLGDDADLRFELGGDQRGLSFDAIDVSGDLTYGGSLTITLLDGLTASVNDTFQLFDVSGVSSGTFDSLRFNRAGWAGILDYNTGLLTLTAVPEPAAYSTLTAFIALAIFTLRRRR